jgi:acetyl esterase/lipase
MHFFSLHSFRPFITASISLVLLISSCSKKEDGSPDPLNPAVATQILNESYGSDPLQKADVYLPANRSAATKTMILIHGGFWTSGDKTDMDTLLVPLKIADPTLAVININYRLANGTGSNQHPAQMNDVKSLLDYVDANADAWHIGKNYALVGVSSGAHIALLYAYGYDPAKRVKVVASVLGPTNFADPLYSSSPIFQQLATGLLGKTWLQDSALHKSVSPVYVVKANAPPTFMAYGGSDPLVPVSNPDALKAKLISLNIPYQYFLYYPEGHELTTPAIIDVIGKMLYFFKTHL